MKHINQIISDRIHNELWDELTDKARYMVSVTEISLFKELYDVEDAIVINEMAEEDIAIYICCRENGDIIEEAETMAEAKEIVSRYEDEDKKNDCYEPNFYDIIMRERTTEEWMVYEQSK
mgnify:CR=1 FL=1